MPIFKTSMAWNQGYSDQENLQWSMLRAIEWGIWPAFLSQPIVPVLLIFFEWWEVIGVFIILTILWSFVRYGYVNVAMARFGVFFVLLRWITVPAAVIYLLIQQSYISAVVALLWPIFLAPYLGIFIGGTKIGKIQEMFMAQLGYSRDLLDADRAEAWFKEGRELWRGHRLDEAAACFTLAAERDHITAQYNLSGMYHGGYGVPQDYAQAAFWCRKAAEQGFAPAQNNLGALYHHGHGVPQDDTQAVFWCRKAVEQGYAGAQHNFEALYHFGHGMPQDDVEVYFYLDLAIADEHDATWRNRVRSIETKPRHT